MTVHTVRYKRRAKGSQQARMVRITIGLEPEMFALLKYIADQRQIPASTVLREAVAFYLTPKGKGRPGRHPGG